MSVSRLHTEIVVRAFRSGDGGARGEVAGAECRLDTPEVSARFRAPGRVIVPLRGPNAPSLDITCRAGEWQGAVRQPLLTRWARGDWPYTGPYSVWDPWYGPTGGAWLGVSIGDTRPGAWGPYGRGAWGGWGGWGGPYWGGATGRPVFFYPDVNVVMR